MGSSLNRPGERLRSVVLAAGLGLTALLVLAACSDASDDGAGAATRAPSATPYIRAGLQAAVVTHVTDGDTIRVEIDGVEYRVRYIGIDTPETVDPRRPVGCFGEEASAYNRRLVDGEWVGLEEDVSETDSFGRLLRYVWVGDEMVNATLVRDGYAQATTYPPDVKYQALFLELQREARGAELGLWGEGCAGGA